jgi:hypothetical protein
MTMSDTRWTGLPDPVRAADLYEGVLAKRLFAWAVDFVIIAVLPCAIHFPSRRSSM